MSMSVMPAATMTLARPISEANDNQAASSAKQDAAPPKPTTPPGANSDLALALEKISNERDEAAVSLLEKALEEARESKSAKPEGMGDKVDQKV